MQLKQTSEFKGCIDETDNILHDAGGGSMSCKHASSSCDLIRSEKLREVTLGHCLKWEPRCFSRHNHVLRGLKRIIQWMALSPPGQCWVGVVACIGIIFRSNSLSVT